MKAWFLVISTSLIAERCHQASTAVVVQRSVSSDSKIDMHTGILVNHPHRCQSSGIFTSHPGATNSRRVGAWTLTSQIRSYASTAMAF